jgi:outer membrane protein TolC
VVRSLVLTGGVQVAREQPGAESLTLDEAIALGLKGNTELKVRAEQERFVHGQILSVGSALVPTLRASGYTQAQEIDLAALGFKPGTITTPGIVIPTITKVNITNAQMSLSQQLFNAPAYMLYRSAQKAGEAANWATLSARGEVVLNVGGYYLRVLADEAVIRNTQGLVKQDELVFAHARASKDAGVGINLDVLRAQVDLQNQQQKLISAINAEAKDKIQLNRMMGQPAGQELQLVDAVPYDDFEASSSDDAVQRALDVAYVRRKDLRGLEAQLAVAQKVQQALRYERLPILSFNGFYGVIGQTTGSYHGNFAATGKLSIPVFMEATLRGQREIAAAQTTALEKQIEAMKATIEGQIRSSLLDVESAHELVKVSSSNVDLATQALNDATLRFTSGVDDNLPVVKAQTSLEGAQTQLVQSEFEYNYAKLMLARNTGVVETEYRTYLGR